MATPMRSLTLDSGLNDSSLTRKVAGKSLVMRLRRTRGVLPTVFVISSYKLVIL